MSAPGRPRDPGVDRRIAQAALDVFAEHGWAGFAMESVARRAGVGKASLYLRWNSKESLLTGAVAMHLTGVADADTGSLHGDLVRLATQILQIYAGNAGRAALRLTLESTAIPGVAEQYEAMRVAEIRAARAIVRRGIDRGELPAGTSVTLLLDTLAGGAMMHAMAMPADRRDELNRDVASHARRLVDFLLRTDAS
ncbi:MAG: TetR/AcrR family transcriptional regulator [Actinoplanes sp.]